MTTANIICDSTLRHQFINCRSLHPGRKPKTVEDTLGIIFKMYRDLRERDRVVTLNLLAAELKRLDPGVRTVIIYALRPWINRHLIKFGIIRRRVTRVALNTRHDMNMTAGYVAFVNEGFSAEKDLACDIVNIDETNIDFDLASGATLDGRVESTTGCTTTGSSNRCTVLLGVKMDGEEKLPPFIIFKGANTQVGANLVIPKTCSTLCRTNHGWTRRGCMTGLILYGVNIPKTHIVEAATRTC
jgi:hypothetical protein